jgi:2-oxoglutarate dehydrogenase E2 component (dihydrolipoamide succinyltransferase)
MTEIRVPQLNANDTTYTLVEWLAGNGDPVEAGAPVATMETAKAVEELTSPAAGVLWQEVPAGWQGPPGAVIGRVAAPGAAPPAMPKAEPSESGPIITAPARALIEEAGIDPASVGAVGKVVRRADVERLIAGADDRAVPLPAVQQAVARAVATSHRTIPAAYTLIQADVDAALAEAAQLGARLRRIVGLTELVVHAAARLHARFPGIFATPGDNGLTPRPADAAHIGLTIDVGRGLFVPVIRDASSKALPEIVEAVGDFRRTALTGTFRARELDGANLVVALHQGRDVILAVPFVFPGQLCALSIAGPRPELRLGEDGTVTSRTVVNIGLAYDHRFVNGRDGNLFLEALKDLLENPG